jgi:hypothetical protein|tara:strand:- start:2193 stop:2477 length:285 start_codon:yes stop_codon:yes gene_type:complete
MIGYIVTICVLSVLVIILGFTTFNLLRKNEKAEDIVVGYLDYLDKISRVIEISDEKVKKIDIKGSFKSDDEIGFFFEQIKNIQEVLNDFKLKKY